MKVIYEDNDVVVIDKPAGITVHPASGDSLVNTVAGVMRSRVNDTDIERPGIVHRLDKNTSGVMIMAKNEPTKAFLQMQFRQRQVEKTYLALLEGHLEHPQAFINLPIARHTKNPLKRAVRAGGKPAITKYLGIQEYLGYTLVEAKPETGRTHQLRVHFAHIGHPVAGDWLYGAKKSSLQRQFLHASSLKLKTTDGQERKFDSKLATELKDFLKTITLQNI